MRTFSTLVAIVALSIFSVHAAPVQHDNHPHQPEHHCPRSVIRTNAIPRDVDDTAHHVPAHHGGRGAHHGKEDTVVPRAGGDHTKSDHHGGHGAHHGKGDTVVPRAGGDHTKSDHHGGHGAHHGKEDSVVPRAGGDHTKSDHHGHGRGAHHGKEDSVVPRDGDEPPCDGEGRGSGKGENTH